MTLLLVALFTGMGVPVLIQDDDEKPNVSLTESLKKSKGDLKAALEAKGLDIEADKSGQVVRILDPMMRGDLKDAEFALLAQFPKLHYLSLRDIVLTSKGVEALATMPQLTTFSLEGTSYRGLPQLRDADLRGIRHLKRLERLDLSNLPVTGACLDFVSDPKTLRSISFIKCPINDSMLARIPRFENLREIEFWDGAITDAGLAHLARCHKLERLELYDCPVSEEGIKSLGRLEHLAEIEMKGAKVADSIVDYLLQLPVLKRAVFGDRQITFDALQRLKGKGVNVQHGILVGFKRDREFLRYDGIDFLVDAKRSALRAYVNPEDPKVAWKIEIECKDDLVPNHMQPAHLTGPYFHADAIDWKALEGKSIGLKLDEAKNHPIAPGNEANIYIGYHAFPNNHRIEFVKRTGTHYHVRWTCSARESAVDNPSPILVDATVSFREVVVWRDEGEMTEKLARQQAARFFDSKMLELESVRGDRATFKVLPLKE